MSQQGMVLLTQALELFGEVKRRQDHGVYRIDIAHTSSDLPNFVIDGRRQITSPFIAAVTYDGQAMAHYLDVDTFHELTEVESIKTRKDLFDTRFNFIAGILVLA